MIVGTVEGSGDAVVSLRIRSPRSEPVAFKVVVDTGFNDWLTLPLSAIQSLALLFREEGRFTLADGSETVSRIYAAEVEWLGAWRRVLVVEMDGGPLLGMAMLRGHRLSIDVRDGGRVEIQALEA
jgi:clan AA aspartic protease